MEEAMSFFQKSEIEQRRSGEGNMMKKLLLFKALKFVVFVVLFFCSCGPETPVNPPFEQPEVKISVPEFSADSAFAYVKKQVDFGPRIPNSKAHDASAAFLIKHLESCGLEVLQQKGSVKAYDGKVLSFNNITARYQPEKTKRIMISAHWDSRPWADEDEVNPDKTFDAANDGGSGVAVILELARVLSKEKKLNVGVDFVLFDAEDYGKPEHKDSYCLGSQYWAKNFPLPVKPIYGINLDMVGDANAKFTYEGLSLQTGRNVLDKVWRSAHGLNFGQYFAFEETSAITDDHAYVYQYTNIPCIDIIDRSAGFARTWHRHDDNLKNISPQTLKAVGQTLLYVLYTE
ncbi:MAG: M28 family peptidase [Flavobacteriales bacterium]